MKDQKQNNKAGAAATRTLHHFWNIPSSSTSSAAVNEASSSSSCVSRVKQSGGGQNHVPIFPARVQPAAKTFESGGTVHLSDDDDDLLLEHAIKLESIQKKSKAPAAEKWQEYLPGFDVEAGQHWLYPKNKPKREYQYAIVRTALFHNTLVSLPTGLGKTFIAAVVMYNFYRWYPTGKVLFVAPTRPLVEQQIEACYNIVGIPQKDMCALTGKKNPKAREEDWRNHRVFFLTPHVLAIDLERNVFPTDDIKCLVVDEAHKATGNYVSCQAVQRLLTDRVHFRVLALSATPGNDLRHVQQVLNNLLIAKIETRTEMSIDVKPYLHGRREERLVVRLEGETKRLKDLFESGLQPMIDNLRRHHVVESSATVDDFSLFKIKLAGDLLRSRNMDKRLKGSLIGQCAVLQSLYHSYDLLIRHGLRALYRHLHETMKSNHLLKTVIEKSEPLTSVWEYLSEQYGQVADVSLNATMIGGGRNAPGRADARELDSIDERVLNSHPKMKYLGQVLNEHFTKHDDKSTRAIVFSSYRDSVDEIADFLRRLKPLIRPTEFKGQTSKRKGDEEAGAQRRGQAEQLRTIQDFQSGKYNVLVSTCVGEEGLDIGEVDLIVCYDTSTSGIRQVQRMGRTGRKRQGRIVHLLAERWEEKNYDRASKKNKTVQSAMNLTANLARFEMFSDSPRMVPVGLNPTPQEVEMTQAASFVREVDRKRRAGDGISAAKQAFYSGAGYLTEREMVEWDRRFKIDFEPAVKHRRVCMTSLGDRPQPNSVDLSSHLLWQDREQPVGKVKHSALTSRFVAVMRGSSRGTSRPSLDFSSLNQDDILLPPDRQHITSSPPPDDVVDIDIDMEAEVAKFDATASSTLVRKPLGSVQAERKESKQSKQTRQTKKRVGEKKGTQKGRGGRQGGVRGRKQEVRPDSQEGTIEFIEMRRPVTAADFVDLREAAPVAERADRLRVLLGLLDAQCELLDWQDYLDDSFDSLISGIEDEQPPPQPSSPTPQLPLRDSRHPVTMDDSRVSCDTAVRMLVQDHQHQHRLEVIQEEHHVKSDAEQRIIVNNDVDQILNHSVDRDDIQDDPMNDGEMEHDLVDHDEVQDRPEALDEIEDDFLNNQEEIEDHQPVDYDQVEVDRPAQPVAATSSAIRFDFNSPIVTTKPSLLSNLENGTTAETSAVKATPVVTRQPLRPIATSSLLGFDFNTPTPARTATETVRQTSLTSTGLKFDLATPLNEERQSTTTTTTTMMNGVNSSGSARLSANRSTSMNMSASTSALLRASRVESLREEATASQTTPSRMQRSASASSTSLGFSFHSPIVDEAGEGGSRPSMVTSLGFSFAPQPRSLSQSQSQSPLLAPSDRRSCSPLSANLAADLTDDIVPPSPEAVISASRSHQLLGGLFVRH